MPSGRKGAGGGAASGASLVAGAIKQLRDLGTGHSDDEIKAILREAGGDMQSASNMLLDT